MSETPASTATAIIGRCEVDGQVSGFSVPLKSSSAAAGGEEAKHTTAVLSPQALRQAVSDLVGSLAEAKQASDKVLTAVLTEQKAKESAAASAAGADAGDAGRGKGKRKRNAAETKTQENGNDDDATEEG